MSGTNPFRRKNIHEEEPGTLPQENNLISDYHHESRTPTIATGEYYYIGADFIVNPQLIEDRITEANKKDRPNYLPTFRRL